MVQGEDCRDDEQDRDPEPAWVSSQISLAKRRRTIARLMLWKRGYLEPQISLNIPYSLLNPTLRLSGIA